jgi:hypothetical protein
VVGLTCARTAEAVVTAVDVDRVLVRDLFHIEHHHPLRPIEPVAVALPILCAVLAASRGCAR